MNERSDIDRVLQHWLDDGPSAMPDRVVDVVAERIALERQRPARRLPWRQRAMNPLLRIGAAVAAVLVIAVVGWSLLATGPSGNGEPSGSGRPGPSDGPSPNPTASPLVYAWPGSLAAGTYSTSLIWDLPFAVEFTVPEGWSGYDVEISKSDDPRLSVEFVLVENTFELPCEQTPREPAVGLSVDDLATALTFLPGLDATSPTPVQFDRWTSGVALGYRISDAVDCPPEAFNLWDLPAERFKPAMPSGGDHKAATARDGRILILDVDGVRFIIRTTWDAESTQAERKELQAIADSIRIVRPARPDASPPPQPAP